MQVGLRRARMPRGDVHGIEGGEEGIGGLALAGCAHGCCYPVGPFWGQRYFSRRVGVRWWSIGMLRSLKMAICATFLLWQAT